MNYEEIEDGQAYYVDACDNVYKNYEQAQQDNMEYEGLDDGSTDYVNEDIKEINGKELKQLFKENELTLMCIEKKKL